MAVGPSSQGGKPAVGVSTVPTPVAARPNYIKEVQVELKKTTWPTWPEARKLTIVVLAVIGSMAIYMGAIDFILSWLFNHFHIIK